MNAALGFFLLLGIANSGAATRMTQTFFVSLDEADSARARTALGFSETNRLLFGTAGDTGPLLECYPDQNCRFHITIQQGQTFARYESGVLVITPGLYRNPRMPDHEDLNVELFRVLGNRPNRFATSDNRLEFVCGRTAASCRVKLYNLVLAVPALAARSR